MHAPARRPGAWDRIAVGEVRRRILALHPPHLPFTTASQPSTNSYEWPGYPQLRGYPQAFPRVSARCAMVDASTDPRSAPIHVRRCIRMLSTTPYPSSSTRSLASAGSSATSSGASRGRASSAPGVPEPYTPPKCEVPAFPPIRPGSRGGRRTVRRAVRRRRKALALGLAMTAAVLAASAAQGAAPRPGPGPHGEAAAAGTHHPPRAPLVRAPVRIADAAAAGLLHPGDRVDVLAGARVVAAGATVVAVPGTTGVPSADAVVPDSSGPGGALVVLAVPRPTAAALSGAATSSPLAVTLC